MKSFDSFGDAFKWVNGVVKDTKDTSISIIAEQIYKDSDKYTYRDTGVMYDTGALHSDFKAGYVVERSPYVRRRYYEGGRAGAGNRMAVPQWFEVTKKENIGTYKKMYAKAFNQQKRG